MHFFLTLIVVSLSTNALSQKKKINKSKPQLEAYGKVAVMGYVLDQDLSLEDAGSRIGFRAKHLVSELGVIAYARGEWRFNAINNTSDLSIGANSNFVSESNSSNTFSRRLGFLGFRSKSFGDLRLGKQWSVYTDVSHFTDVFNLYGGAASGTYNLNTDGGQSGTGRASKSITYRNNFWGFHYGLQAKLIQNNQLTVANTETDLKAKDAFGVSLKRKFFKILELGIAYNQIDMEGDEGAVTGYNGKNSWSAVAGFVLNLEYLKIGAIYNQSENHELDSEDEIIDGEGVEAYIRYFYTPKTTYYLGYNHLKPRDDDYEKDYKIDDIIAGFDIKVSDIRFYLEGKASNSKNHEGETGKNSAGLGVVYYFNY